VLLLRWWRKGRGKEEKDLGGGEGQQNEVACCRLTEYLSEKEGRGEKRGGRGIVDYIACKPV